MKRSPLFSAFSRDELLAVIHSLRLDSFTPGQVLVSEGAAPKALRDLVRPDAVPVALERDHRIFLYEEGLGLLPGDRLYLVAAREVADEVLAPFFPE